MECLSFQIKFKPLLSTLSRKFGVRTVIQKKLLRDLSVGIFCLGFFLLFY